MSCWSNGDRIALIYAAMVPGQRLEVILDRPLRAGFGANVSPRKRTTKSKNSTAVSNQGDCNRGDLRGRRASAC
jgi:hypothetical protein